MFIRWRCPVQSLLLPFHEWMETLLDPPSSGDQIYPGSPGTRSLWVHDFYSLRLLWRVCQRTQYTTLQGPLGNKSEVFRFDPFYALLKGQKGRLKRFTTHQALNTQSLSLRFSKKPNVGKKLTSSLKARKYALCIFSSWKTEQTLMSQSSSTQYPERFHVTVILPEECDWSEEQNQILCTSSRLPYR